MPRITWKVERYTSAAWADVTSLIRSMELTLGKQNFLDDYTGSSLTFTMTNSTESTMGALMTVQTPIRVTYTTQTFAAPAPVTVYFAMGFVVKNTVFNDVPGTNVGYATATVSCEGALQRLGRVTVTSAALAANTFIYDQVQQLLPYSFYTTANGVGVTFNGTGTIPLAGGFTAQTYANTYADELRLLMNTALCTIYEVDGVTPPTSAAQSLRVNITPYPTPPIASTAYTLSRTASATAIGYNNLVRLGFGETAINTFSVTSVTGLATQTATDATSVALIGTAAASQEQVPFSTGAALNNAQYTASTLANSQFITSIVTWNDLAQNQTMLDTWGNTWYNAYPISTLQYLKPGAGSETSQQVCILGMTYNMTPASTDVEMYLVPGNYVAPFLLNSTRHGILDNSALGF